MAEETVKSQKITCGNECTTTLQPSDDDKVSVIYVNIMLYLSREQALDKKRLGVKEQQIRFLTSRTDITILDDEHDKLLQSIERDGARKVIESNIAKNQNERSALLEFISREQKNESKR